MIVSEIDKNVEDILKALKSGRDPRKTRVTLLPREFLSHLIEELAEVSEEEYVMSLKFVTNLWALKRILEECYTDRGLNRITFAYFLALAIVKGRKDKRVDDWIEMLDEEVDSIAEEACLSREETL